MGLTKAKKAKKLLNRYAPKGEQLAYINDREARLLKKLGGAGKMTTVGIKSYFDDSGDDYGGYDSGPSNSSSNNDNDSGDPYYDTYTAPTPTPTQTFAEDDYTLTPEETKEQQDTISSSIDDLKNTIEDDGTSLYVTTPDSTYDEEVGIYNAPTFKDPDYDDDQKALSYIEPIEEPKSGFFDRGIGKGIKNVAKFALPFVAPQVAGALGLAKPYQAYSTFNRGKKVAKFVDKNLLKGKGKTALTTALTNMPKGPSVKGPTGFNNDGNDGNNNIIPKNVIAAGREQYSPERINALKKDIDLFGDVIQNRTYTIKGNTINLNNSQIAQVANKRSELMKEYDMIKDYQVT